ncbi:tail length tape measure protein [Arthrobacter phage Amigo]|uniref:Tape measure protein n=5 Tax=Amigovirus amigo TaxID=1982100 RepID=A0A5J6TBZ0_9CAUD|nr:tail length tape measure protein [Arthrobacter phage Amigo]QFG08330.1 tape measure protein [Arthrobacter phage Yeezus]QFG13378.1 tape measure protein [Arthrobacter phage Ichor]QFG13896.1 tape measure protein [Arthrobacter phage Jaek]QJD51683.1 tape measure protein [Arthrobacter phage Boersma]ALY08391.1 tape measure protein [Arthrobacter phage Amigo]
MANEFEAKVEVDTSGAAKDLKNVDAAVEKLDTTLNSLDKTLNRFQGTLSKTTAALQSATRAQRDSDSAADKSAAATLKLATARERDSRAALNAARTEAVSRREREATARANENAANSFQGVTGAIRGYTGAAHEADQSTLALSGSMSNTRYLLYDIGATYRAISAALLTIPVATTAVAASFEKDFAQVERTTVGTTANMGELKESLKDLTTEIPLSFTEISKIASLGAQLGIQAENLASFTETVAKFSAATGVSAEEAGAAFGRIGSAFKLNPEDYDKLGSAIAKVGVSSAATETEIIAITQQLAPLASLAGFSAQEVVGLSGALASMRIRPELARGAFQSTIFKITEAVENGGTKLQAYATIMGKTQDQVAKQFNSDPSGFFRDYIAGIGKAMENGQSFSSILDELGVKEKRERQFILAMANQYGFLGEQIDLANKAYAEGTFLDESSAKVFETFAANLQKLGNALANLGETLGAKSLGVLSNLVSVMKDGTVAITDFIQQNPALGQILSVLMGFGAVVGVFYAIRTAMAFVMAAMVGFQQVAGKAALQTTFSLKGIAAQAAVTALVTKGATSSMAADFVRMNGTLAAGNARMITGSDGVVTSIQKQGGAIRGLGSAMLSFVGGPIGVLVGALSVLTLGYLEAEGAAKSMAQQIQSADTDDAKFKIAAEGLSKITANFGNVGLAFDAYGKNVGEIAGELGIKFEDLVNISLKGKAGAAELEQIVTRVAKSKGYLNEAAFLASSDADAAKLRFVTNEVSRLANQNEGLAKSAETADEAMKKVGVDSTGIKKFGDEAEGASSKIDVLTKNINDAAAAAFGIVNAGAAANDALYRLGQSLQESNDFSINSEGGRNNLENAQNAVTKYAMSLAQQRAADKITAEQMAADYAAYLEGLYSELIGRGVDPAQATEFINQAKTIMQGAAQSGDPVTVPITADGSQAKQVAGETASTIQAGLDAAAPSVPVDADTQQAQTNIGDLAYYAALVIGSPFIAPVTADTQSGVENVNNFTGYAEDVISDPFIAPVTADTTSGQNNLIQFANWARTLLNGIQIAIAAATGNLQNLSNQAAARRDVSAPEPLMAKRPAVVQSAPVSIPAPVADSRPNAALRNLGQGYDDAAAKAAKAGNAGKKAGKDAADGINDAAKAVNDYADRLKTGLTEAFDKQHGLQKATDDYYTALNSINKKRKEDLKSIQDLIDKQKELNNAREGDLVAARKAEIEAAISRKYGEGDRARDYEQQAEEARLAAAEKQKNIDTSREEQLELQNGMYALDGYSQAAIDNRNALRDLESKMVEMISAYAATGASQNQVAAYAANLTRTFGIQVTQMGYNQGSVNALIGTTQRYIDTIYRVPTRVHTDSSNDFGAGARDAGGLTGAINAIPRSHNTTFTASAQQFFETVAQIGKKTSEAWDNIGKAKAAAIGVEAGPAFRKYTGGIVGPGYASGGLIPGTPPSDPTKDNLLARVDGKGLVQVRSREFIQPEPAVDYYGLPFMEAIRNMTLPRYNVGGPVGVPKSGGSAGQSGPMVVELTAENLRALAAMADKPVVLYADAAQLASTVNEGNDILASRGVK